MAKNEIPKLINRLKIVSRALTYTAPARATEKVVKTLQVIGPRWTGLFSNSYIIKSEQYGLIADGSQQTGNPTPVLFSGGPPVSAVEKVLAARESIFLIGNNVYYAEQATDLEGFRPEEFTSEPPLKPVREGIRDQFRGLRTITDEGVNLETAPLDWFTDYAQKGGKMQTEVETAFKSVFEKIK